MDKAGPPARRRIAGIARIDAARCTGCGWCLPSCELHLLWLDTFQGRKTSTLHDPGACTGCRRCEVRCPFDAITMHPDPRPPPPPGRPPG